MNIVATLNKLSEDYSMKLVRQEYTC
uniref:Uncharacterized protein n=1 Tax=Rhizophora mucronata TaxID=61149 RepID=A0A2P2IM09_RHIMU